MKTGIYCIRNLITSGFYIGSAAVSIEKRWYQHRHRLRAGKHYNLHLQAAWRFYGESSFQFSVLEECPPEKCIEREQWFIDIFDPEYNICQVAGSPLGYRHTAEARAKMSASQKGKPSPRRGCHLSMDHKEKLRLANLGKKPSPEHCANISAALKGRIISPEWRAKISASHIGLRPSEAARKIMSEAQKRRPISEKMILHLKTIQAANRGRRCSAEHRQKISIASKGKSKSEEHRRHLSEAIGRRLQQRQIIHG